MSEHSEGRHESGPIEARLDRELNLRGLVISVVGLVLLVVLAAVAMWWLSLRLRGEIEAKNPPPPLLPEARLSRRPPEPHLQASPGDELRTMQEEVNRTLTTYAWVDEEAGIARVPIERAMEMMSEKGLGGPPQPSAGETVGSTPEPALPGS